MNDVLSVVLFACLPFQEPAVDRAAVPELLQRHLPLPEVDWPRPRDMRFADLDGDGDVDGIAPEGSFSDLHFFWNRGHGAFRLERDTVEYLPEIDDIPPYDTAPIVDGVRPGDLDGDGDVDLLLSAYLFDYDMPLGLGRLPLLVPLENEGNGSFRRVPVLLVLPELAGELELGDLDGDGGLDVFFVTSSGPGWARNTGEFTFEVTEGLLPEGLSGVEHPLLADLDGDGDTDAVLVSGGDGPRLLLNDGSGEFALGDALLPAFPGDELLTVAASDVDLDGDVDLLLGTSAQDQEPGVLLYRNDAALGFALVEDALPADAPRAEALATLDLDGDGDPDLVASSRAEGTQLYENLGGQLFAVSAGAPPGAPDTLGEALMRVADVDGDRVEDLVRLDVGRPEAWLGDGDGGFVPAGDGDELPAELDTSFIFRRAWVEALDVDGDGDLDAVLPEGILRNDGTGAFALEAEAFDSISYVTSGDVDGDGDPDLVSQRMLHRNDGSGTFTSELDAIEVDEDGTSFDPELGDLDGDGDLDLFLPQFAFSSLGPPQKPHRNAVLRNDGTGRFELGPELPAETTSRTADLGDLDGDGDLDVAVAHDFGMELLFNEGDLVFADGSAGIPADLDGSSGVAIGDLDGDDDLDVYLGASYYSLFYGGGTDQVLHNDGTGFFTRTEVDMESGHATDVELVDLDGDGDLDSASSGSQTRSGSVVNSFAQKVMANDGSGGFEAAPYPGVFEPAIAVGDFDGDGDPDVLTGVSLYRNQRRALAWLVRPRLGHVLELELRGTPGRYALLAGGLALQVGAVTPLGGLALDPDTLVFRSSLQLDDEGTALVRFQVPPDPALAGTRVYWQALIGAPLRASELEVTSF